MIFPPVGYKVRCWFLANSYAGRIVRYNRTGKPVVRFALKNGKVKEGPATVCDAAGPLAYQYKGYLAQLASQY